MQQYNQGLIGGFRQIIAEEGAMALTTGLGATAAGWRGGNWATGGAVGLGAASVVGADCPSCNRYAAKRRQSVGCIFWLRRLDATSGVATGCCGGGEAVVTRGVCWATAGGGKDGRLKMEATAAPWL